MILASDLHLKIFADTFAWWKTHGCLSVFNIRKNLMKGLEQR